MFSNINIRSAYPLECLVNPTASPMMSASNARTTQARMMRKVRRLIPKYDRDRGRMALNFSCNTAFPPARLPVCDVVVVAPTLYVCTALESHSGRTMELGCGGGWSGAVGACTCVDITDVFSLSSFRFSNSPKTCYKQETRVATRGYLCDNRQWRWYLMRNI
jgi:hypothetical protein